MSGFAFKNPKSERLFELLRCAERKGWEAAAASPVPVLLAPMAGITDSAFRRLCIEQGCDFTITEMVSANGLHYKNRKTQELISISEAEKPCGVQLFGHDPEIIAETVERLFEGLVSKSEVSIVDINMGCPAPKITSNGDGSALMKNPALAGKIIEAAVKVSPVPVSVKFRKGWDEGSVNAVEHLNHPVLRRHRSGNVTAVYAVGKFPHHLGTERTHAADHAVIPGDQSLVRRPFLPLEK